MAEQHCLLNDFVTHDFNNKPYNINGNKKKKIYVFLDILLNVSNIFLPGPNFKDLVKHWINFTGIFKPHLFSYYFMLPWPKVLKNTL